MKKAVKCPNCNTYFDLTNIYGEKTTILCNCENCKFPLFISMDNFQFKEIISLLSDKKYYKIVRDNFINYPSNYVNKPPINYSFNF